MGVVKALLESGNVNVNAVNGEFAWPSLVRAARMGNEEVIIARAQLKRATQKLIALTKKFNQFRLSFSSFFD